MKIPLDDQITEAETHRAELHQRRDQGEDVQTRIDRVEGHILTLCLLKSVEPEFREYMRQRPKPQRDEANG